MAAAVGIINGASSSSSSSWAKVKNMRKNRNKVMGNRARVFSVSSSYSVSTVDPYSTLKIHRGASESEVKKAFRQLALQYHPDVCRGSNCGVQFHRINEAYDIVMSDLRGEPNTATDAYDSFEHGMDDQTRGMDDPDYDLWEEWMGWEGAGIRDYSSHINPYT